MRRNRPLARSLVALTASVAIVLGGCGGAPSDSSAAPVPAVTRARPAPPTVEASATPTGWRPVDDADAQISVPSSWLVSVGGCPADAPGTVFLHGPENLFCPEEQSALTQVWIYRPTAAPPGSGARTVNGIGTFAFGSVELVGEFVPSMGIEFEAQGPLARRVLHTLTYSPRAVALGSGPFLRSPSSWRRVAFAGIALSVPSAWTEQQSSNWSSGCEYPDLTLPDGDVVLDRGTSGVVPGCPSETGASPVRSGVNGVVIDPGPYGPLTPETKFARCRRIHGLRVCPSESDPYDILVVVVYVRDVSSPVALEIGLAGSGELDRAVIGSIRQA